MDVISLSTSNSEEENKTSERIQSNQQLPIVNQDEKIRMKRISRETLISSNSFHDIYVLPKEDINTNIPAVLFTSSPHNSNHQQYGQSSDTETIERQSSIFNPSSPTRSSTILVWKNLIVSTREKKQNPLLRCFSSKKPVVEKKCLLHNVSGAITGGLWAVMGPSGSGKSTLLNTLACRLDVNTIAEGEMRLNGAPYDNAELKRISGYVMQDDLLNEYLTVEETLMFTGELRLPRTFTYQQRKDRVENALNDLGLVHVRYDIIGTQSKQGISGSERKRLCVGMQLLNRPQLLFLDEPTTGLDSVTALDLLHILYGLAHGNSQENAVTIVCSIHQPQAKIFNLFDAIVLLKAGHIIYQGSRKQTAEIFRAAGCPCPLYTNIADHILDVITPPKNSELSISREQQANIDEAIIKAQPPFHIDLNMGNNKNLDQIPYVSTNPPWHKQVRILFRRNFREYSRKIRLTITSITHVIIMGVLIGTAFLKIGNTQTSIIRREPVLFFSVLNQGIFAALTVINSFPVERTLALRERASGNYFASAYFTAKILVDILIQVPIPIVFSCIVYFLVGLQLNGGKFFLFTLFNVLCAICSTSMALLISAFCRTTALSVTVLPMVLEVTRLFGGLYIAPSRVPKYLSWIDALSYVKYAFIGATLNELQGLDLNCQGLKTVVVNATYNMTVGTCIKNGEILIEERGYDYLNIGSCIAVLFSFIIFCRACAFIGVRFLKH